MTRPIRPFVTLVAVALALVGAAACGIDEDKVADGVQNNVGADSTTSTTATTEPGGPDISLPDIPSDVTEPESTVPDPSEPAGHRAQRRHDAGRPHPGRPRGGLRADRLHRGAGGVHGLRHVRHPRSGGRSTRWPPATSPRSTPRS